MAVRSAPFSKNVCARKIGAFMNKSNDQCICIWIEIWLSPTSKSETEQKLSMCFTRALPHKKLFSKSSADKNQFVLLKKIKSDDCGSQTLNSYHIWNKTGNENCHPFSKETGEQGIHKDTDIVIDLPNFAIILALQIKGLTMEQWLQSLIPWMYRYPLNIKNAWFPCNSK